MLTVDEQTQKAINTIKQSSTQQGALNKIMADKDIQTVQKSVRLFLAVLP